MWRNTILKDLYNAFERINEFIVIDVIDELQVDLYDRVETRSDEFNCHWLIEELDECNG